MLHLDLLRFVASSGIVLHHSLEFFFSRGAARAAEGVQTYGLSLFVDLFFVISGYVIASIYADRMSSAADFGRFMQRRVGRLVPLHWLTMALSMVFWGLVIHFGAVANHAPSFQLSCIATTAVLLNAAFPCDAFNAVNWSISAEMGMYAAFPLVALLARRSAFAPFVLCAALLVLAFIAAGSLSALTPEAGWTGAVPVYLRAAPSFVLGVALWYGRDFVVRLPAPRAVLSASLCALIVALLTFPNTAIDLALVYCVAVSGVASDLRGRVSATVLRLAPLGNLTYSIYMWHPLFVLAVMNVIGDKLLKLHGLPMLALATATYAAIFAWSWVSYLKIETPARRWVDKLPLFQPAQRQPLPTAG